MLKDLEFLPPARRVMLAQSDVTMSREFAELTRRRSGTDIRLSTKSR